MHILSISVYIHISVYIYQCIYIYRESDIYTSSLRVARFSRTPVLVCQPADIHCVQNVKISVKEKRALRFFRINGWLDDFFNFAHRLSRP